MKTEMLTVDMYSWGSAAARRCWARGERVGTALVVNLRWRLPRASGEGTRVAGGILLEFTRLFRLRKGDRGLVNVGNGGSSRGEG